MTKTTIGSIVGITLLLTLLLGCGTFGLAVRAGVVGEQLVWFPPNTRYQMIVRVGNDALPWDRRRGHETAINLWIHGRGTGWHIVNILHIPIGQTRESRE